MKRPEGTLTQVEKAVSAHDKVLYILRLYISGASPKSTKAINNIKKICEQYLPGQYELEVVDVYQQPRLAVEAEVVAAPTLIKRLPLPLRRLIGDLSNTRQILQRLGLVREGTDLANTR